MPRPVKDCFGTVISSLNKMKECVRCELLAECRAINWNAPDHDRDPVITRRRPGGGPEGAGPDIDSPGAGSLP